MIWGLFLTYLAACAAAASTGMLFKPGPWYDRLAKPAWTPKKWMFPVVWTALYILSAYAAARVALQPGSGQALAFWALQIALNTLWTPVFFGAHKMGAGMAVIALLWVTLAAVSGSFLSLDLLAGLLMLPYILWVTLAAMLNFRVWRDNRAS